MTRNRYAKVKIRYECDLWFYILGTCDFTFSHNKFVYCMPDPNFSLIYYFITLTDYHHGSHGSSKSYRHWELFDNHMVWRKCLWDFSQPYTLKSSPSWTWSRSMGTCVCTALSFVLFWLFQPLKFILCSIESDMWKTTVWEWWNEWKFRSGTKVFGRVLGKLASHISMAHSEWIWLGCIKCSIHQRYRDVFSHRARLLDSQRRNCCSMHNIFWRTYLDSEDGKECSKLSLYLDFTNKFR